MKACPSPCNTKGADSCNGARLPFAQERLWLAYLLDPRSPSYSSTVCLRLTGEWQQHPRYGRQFRADQAIGDLAQEIIALTGFSHCITVDEERLRPEKSEVMRLLSDNRKARERLGWSPRVDIRAGLQRTIAWIRDHLDLYRPGRYEL